MSVSINIDVIKEDNHPFLAETLLQSTGCKCGNCGFHFAHRVLVGQLHGPVPLGETQLSSSISMSPKLFSTVYYL